MKMAMSEASKAAFELGMEISGTLAPVTDPELAASTNRFVHGFFTEPGPGATWIRVCSSRMRPGAARLCTEAHRDGR